MLPTPVIQRTNANSNVNNDSYDTSGMTEHTSHRHDFWSEDHAVIDLALVSLGFADAHKPRVAKMLIAFCGLTLLLALIVIMSWFAGISYEHHIDHIDESSVVFWVILLLSLQLSQ